MSIEPTNNLNADPTNANTLPQWPPRPANEVFPPLLDTLLVAQLFPYDRLGMAIEQARRNIRKLVRESGLPTLGRIGSMLMFRQTAVIEWLAHRKDVDGDVNDARVDAA